MELDYFLGLAVFVALFGYLAYALIKPEKF